jgi:hypothetical protein
MVVKPFLTAYDAFYPALSKADIVPFLSEKARKYSMINTKNSVEDIQWNIEEGIVKQIFPSIQKAQIRGNTGMHQSALALAALVIDNEELSREWMEWIFAPGYIERKENDRYRITGGNMAAAIPITFLAPAFFNSLASSLRVLPVVTTSSAMMTILPFTLAGSTT